MARLRVFDDVHTAGCSSFEVYRYTVPPNVLSWPPELKRRNHRSRQCGWNRCYRTSSARPLFGSSDRESCTHPLTRCWLLDESSGSRKNNKKRNCERTSVSDRTDGRRLAGCERQPYMSTIIRMKPFTNTTQIKIQKKRVCFNFIYLSFFFIAEHYASKSLRCTKEARRIIKYTCRQLKIKCATRNEDDEESMWNLMLSVTLQSSFFGDNCSPGHMIPQTPRVDRSD